MTLPFLRRIVGFYVFLLVFAVGPSALLKVVPETTRPIGSPAPGAVAIEQGLSDVTMTAGACKAAGLPEGCWDAAFVEELKAAGLRVLQAGKVWPDSLFCVRTDRPLGSG